MNLLPFVISFLLILMIGSSTLFTSLSSTGLEKKIIFTKHEALLSLITTEAQKRYKHTKIREEPKKDKSARKREKRESQTQFPDHRKKRNYLSDGKLNLWRVISDENNPESKLFYEKAIRLIEILYQATDFYQAANDPELARKIVNGMCKKNSSTLQELYPGDPVLDAVYYKMLKGTNTGYPALEEYFKIDPRSKKIKFRYASPEMLKAVLGHDLADKILQQEKSKWEQKRLPYILNKEELQELVKFSQIFDINHLEVFFDFTLKKNGTIEACVHESSHVMAKR